MKCKEWTDLVFDYQDGRLAEAEKAEFEHHLRACPACSARLGEISEIDGLLQKTVTPAPGADFTASWQKIAAALAPDRRVYAPRSRRAPRWAFLAAGFLAFFILGVGFARLYFSPAGTENTASADAPFLYSARDYFAALQPVLSEFSNAPAAGDGAAFDSARLRRLLNNLQLLRLRADRNRDASLLALLDDIELVLLEIAHLDRSNPENTRLVNTLIQEKGITMKMKVYKFRNRKAVSI
ncbi:MAG: zf-HC2 domain-containing protein [Candidatus Aminicenantes bacterium]|nr:zf-HC2 domain-containing protein [Candidatus Aminicenantes bacterium]